jgi:hypothetical protein
MWAVMICDATSWADASLSLSLYMIGMILGRCFTPHVVSSQYVQAGLALLEVLVMSVFWLSQLRRERLALRRRWVRVNPLDEYQDDMAYDEDGRNGGA